MVNLIDIFESIEQFAYKVLIWIILAPKTLGKIIIEPQWAPNYITKELKEKEINRFDDYFSPVFLIILVSLLPFIYFKYYAIRPGVTVSSPYAIHIGESALLKVEKANFISSNSEYPVWATWIDYAQDTNLPLESYSSNYLTVQYKGVEVGEKNIYLMVESNSGEIVTEYVQLYVGDKGVDLSKYIYERSQSFKENNNQPRDITTALKETETITASVFFLGIPMLFALVIESFRGQIISGETLKRSYLIQCYYFSPLYIAVYAGLFAPGYLLMDVEKDIFLKAIQLILVCIIFWLIIVETRLITIERVIHWFYALLITFSLLFLVSLLIITSLNGTLTGDNVRIGLWYFYSGAGILLIGISLISWLIKSVKRQRKH